MPDFPQYPNALLVTSANYRTGLDANVTANSGDVLRFTPTASRVVTLPSVSQGGPVLVALGGAFGKGYTVSIELNVVDLEAGVKIDGGAHGLVNAITLNNSGDQVVLASDGSATWWIIDKAHNTTDSW